ncbi:MAG: VOC family protein [Candidatus Dependentiae bacterium]
MITPRLDFVLLFVKNPAQSAQFYETIFGIEPVEQSPTFALFVLQNGVKIGLWSQQTAEPTITALPGAMELAFEVPNVDKIYEDWQKKGIAILQKPTEMDFGRTFVALDLDGHRIRILKLKED